MESYKQGIHRTGIVMQDASIQYTALGGDHNKNVILSSLSLFLQKIVQILPIAKAIPCVLNTKVGVHDNDVGKV